MHETDLLADIGTAIVAATALALVGRALRQPLILAYLLAGVAIGPEVGLALVHSHASIQLIAEIGLILLLFIIGLEMDLPKLAATGRALVVTGAVQFPACVAIGTAGALLLGLPLGGGRFDAVYVGIALALSSTMIVVKLLYDKNELMTQPGRVTLGILVFQDVWAILVLALQPSFADPSAAALGSSLLKGALLVAVSLLASRFVLPRLFAPIAKLPELLLVAALAWCFLVAGVAARLGLSREMGALIAGLGMSTFPYSLDVIAKVANIRDFFVTLFFVGLGMQIPAPTPWLCGLALAISALLLVSRVLVVAPLLYLLGTGLRASLLPAVNLGQMSEFSLVIAALGLGFGHLDAQVVSVLTFAFAFTAVLSTYLIAASHPLQEGMVRLLGRLGVRETDPDAEPRDLDGAPSVVFLGFYREASSIVHQFELAAAGGRHPVLRELLVIDFNPAVLAELKRRGLRALYGDVGSLDTLHHAPIHHARVVVCTLTDAILRGTNNRRLLAHVNRVCPEAAVIVSADTIAGALELYDAGAGFVFIPRLHSAHHVAEVIEAALHGGLEVVRGQEAGMLRTRDEVLA